MATAVWAGLGGPPAAFGQVLRSDQFFRHAGVAVDLAANRGFMPSPAASPAHAPFLGALVLGESEMTTHPAVLASRNVMGRDPKLFPGVTLAFFTDRGDLVPFTQDVIRAGTAASGRSFWDIIVQPGRVWSEPGDGQWSRAAFPFALVNSIEGETHNGVAGFLYKHGRISDLRFQIVQQTAPFYVTDHFTAAGLVAAAWTPAPNSASASAFASAPAPAVAGSGDHRVGESLADLMRRYEASIANPIRIADWSELAAKVGRGRLEGFDGTMPASDIVLAGLDYGGTFYLEECRSAAGPLPWCDRARFGVWSATKALVNETALLRLAQKYGPEVFDLKIRDYVPQAASHAGWNDVRFENAIDMATGIGNGTEKSEPNDISDGYLDPSYKVWYEARSADEKVGALLDTGHTHSWGPGKVARYRDQDMFILGVAMNAYLKSKEGPRADLWSMLENEVFAPIGIFYAPTNRTLEPGAAAGQPLMAYGYYPTLGDMVRLARLYQSGGKQGGAQILYGPRIEELLHGRSALPGLATGEKLSYGETRYRNAFWLAPFVPPRPCRDTRAIYYPRMIGWGGNIVALMPDGLTGIRLAKSAGTPDNSDADSAGMARVSDRLSKFCE